MLPRAPVWLLGLALAAASGASCAAEPPDTSRQVDLARPAIGTGGRAWNAGNAFVGATLPFGLVQVGPDTTGPDGPSVFSNCSGYNDADDTIMGFSHVHLHATGIPDLGNILFTPTMLPIDGASLARGHWSRFDKASEQARPGHYAVTLGDTGIRVDLTATERAAYHRYEFPASAAARVLVDVGHTLVQGHATDGAVEILPDAGEVRGWVHGVNQFTNAYGGLTVYFAARFDPPPTTHGSWSGTTVADGVTAQSGAAVGAWLGFPAGAVVEAQVGISYVGMEQARANLDAELPAWGFEAARQAAEDRWQDELSVVKFDGGTRAQREVMATALYHSFLMPNLFSDAGGSYLGFDRTVHDAAGTPFYTNFSLWDTYRTQHPLLTLVKPDRQRDMMQSLVRMYEQGGYLPKWPMGAGETNVMVGTPADIVLAESHLKGITGFDVEKAYEGMLATATRPTPAGSGYEGRQGVEDYVALGYVAADHTAESVSNTMEYAVADAAIGALAAALGKSDAAAAFAARGRSYRNLWDPGTQFFRGRNANGSWVEPFDPLALGLVTGVYTEGDAWQYRWLALQDPAGLVALYGSPDGCAAVLAEFMRRGADEHAAPPATDNEVVMMLTPAQYYWHGNEPDIHAAYLFLAAGRPDLTQRWVRWIMDTLYGTGPDGLPGNDDAGTLSAWFVFSALGFYPVAGSDLYLVGTPLFPRAEVRLAGGVLVIEAPAASRDDYYVQSVTLSGQPLDVPWFRHADIAAGGTLRFDLGPKPSTWGVVGPEVPFGQP